MVTAWIKLLACVSNPREGVGFPLRLESVPSDNVFQSQKKPDPVPEAGSIGYGWAVRSG